VDCHKQQQAPQQAQQQQAQQQAQQAQQAVDPSTRLYLEAVKEQLIAKHTTEVSRRAGKWGCSWVAGSRRPQQLGRQL